MPVLVPFQDDDMFGGYQFGGDSFFKDLNEH